MDEKISKKNAGELAEEIDATGQESEEKAVKWVKEIEERNEKDRQTEEAKNQEFIEKKRKYKKNDYYEALLREAKIKLKEYDIPKGYAVDVILKDEGKLVFGLQKIGFRWYAKGMNICGEPKYDRNCIARLVVQTMISLDELSQQHEMRRTASGIILPTRKL